MQIRACWAASRCQVGKKTAKRTSAKECSPEDLGRNTYVARGFLVAGAHRDDLGAMGEREVVEALRERCFQRGVQLVSPPSLRLGAPQANLANSIVGQGHRVQLQAAQRTAIHAGSRRSREDSVSVHLDGVMSIISAKP